MSEYRIGSYWKSANLGDPKLLDFFSGDHHYIVEEKIDGSQFSFAKVGNRLYARSRGKDLNFSTPEKMFSKAVAEVVNLEKVIPENVVFRGEAVTSPKHNTLKYSNTPPGYIVLFGAENAITGEVYNRDELSAFGETLQLMVTPLLHEHKGSGLEVVQKLKDYLSLTSVLGGALVEGVVVKRVDSHVYFMDKPVFAKLVSEAFREQHKVAWSESNPDRSDILQKILLELSGPARYAKAVQHLKECGKIEGSVRDIGDIIAEVKRDVVEEGEAHAKEALWNWAKDKIARGAGAGVPQWYKDKLQKDLEESLLVMNA